MPLTLAPPRSLERLAQLFPGHPIAKQMSERQRKLIDDQQLGFEDQISLVANFTKALAQPEAKKPAEPLKGDEHRVGEPATTKGDDH